MAAIESSAQYLMWEGAWSIKLFRSNAPYWPGPDQGGRVPDGNVSPLSLSPAYQCPDNSAYKYATDKMQWKLIFYSEHNNKTLLLVIRNNIWL